MSPDRAVRPFTQDKHPSDVQRRIDRAERGDDYRQFEPMAKTDMNGNRRIAGNWKQRQDQDPAGRIPNRRFPQIAGAEQPP